MAQGGTEEALEAAQELDGIEERAGSKGWLPVVQTWGHVADKRLPVGRIGCLLKK